MFASQGKIDKYTESSLGGEGVILALMLENLSVTLTILYAF